MLFARQSLQSLAPLAFGVLVSVLLTRALGAEGRGAYSLAVSLAGLILSIAQWGVPEVLLQFIAERGRGQLGTLAGTSMAMGIVGSLVVGLVVVFIAPWFGSTLLKDVPALMVAMAAVGSGAALVGLLARRFIQLDGRLGLYNALDIARNAVFLGLAIALGVLLAAPALGAMYGWLFAEVALALVGGIYVWRVVVPRWRFDRKLAFGLVAAGLPVQAGLLATYLGNEGGRFVLNDRLDLAAVGIYVAALSVARLVIQVSMALRTALQPRLVASAPDAADVTVRVTRHGMLWMTLLAIGLALGSPLMPIVFGRDFLAGGPVLVLLLPGMVAYGVAQLLAGHLHRVGQRGILAVSSWAFALASIVFQAVGVTAGGLMGAALGLTLAYGLMVAIVAVAFTRAADRPLASLLPGRSELAFYPSLLRQARTA